MVSDVLRHCSKIVSILSLIRFNCPQLTPVVGHLTQYVLKCPCLSNKKFEHQENSYTGEQGTISYLKNWNYWFGDQREDSLTSLEVCNMPN
jgi:hypothetical protein